MPLPTKFVSVSNLELAFERVIRAQNRDYKAYFRHLYPSYQLALNETLEDLAAELKTGRYEPSRATCIFQPKQSGILRPLRLLSLTDQIVYQSIINVIANAFRADQRKYAFQRSFGAILGDKTSLFFYRSWKRCYRRFDAFITNAFKRGNDYVADFDLVSFYELIDHTLLRKVLERRVSNPDLLELLFRCLRRWTENDQAVTLGHGIPQGPEASGFLAECFLFRFDRLNLPGVLYARYVDDIKLMASHEIPVRRALLRLDIASKQVGLVPQAQKIECRKIGNIEELRKNVPSSVVSISATGRVSRASQKRLERLFRRSIVKKRGTWVVTNPTRFKFSLFRLKPRRSILRRVGQILLHRPDLSWVFARYIMKFPSDVEAADLLLLALRRDPTYDMSAARYIEAMDVCEPSTKYRPYRRVIQTAERRSEEKSLVLAVAAATFRGRRSGPKDALRLISKQRHALSRSILLHRLFGHDPRAPFKLTDAQTFIETETCSTDPDLARYCASQLIGIWPWTKSTWTPGKHVNESVMIFLKSVGLRKRGPRKVGILTRFFKEQQRIAIQITWRKALEKDLPDAERRCLRLQELAIGDASAWVLMLDTFNELLIQNFSRRHPRLLTAFARATPAGTSHPDYGNWLRHPLINSVLPRSANWFREVHAARVKADLAHARSKRGVSTRPVSYNRRRALKRQAQAAWAELLRSWKRIL